MFKGYLNSLRGRLMLALSLVSLLIWLGSTAIQWRKVEGEINRLFDSQQILFAERIASSTILRGFHLSQPRVNRPSKRAVPQEALAFAVFTERGDLIFNDGREGKYLPFQPHKGFHRVEVQDDEGENEVWQLFWLKRGDVFIVVGQDLAYRQAVISDIVFTQLWAWLAGLPLLLLAIFLVLGYELRLLHKLKEALTQRRPDDYSALNFAKIPGEIAPLVDSLNHYFQRTQQMLEHERHFTSHAAHELRSPLAGLRLQSELAQMTQDDPILHAQSLANITLSVDRISQLIEQLLTLSRLDNIEKLDDLESLDWQQLVSQTLAEIPPLAAKARTTIEMCVLERQPPQQGKPLLIGLLLRNLVENARQYTADGSVIRLSLSAKGLSVEDNGSEIRDEDIQQLGQRFFRPTQRPRFANGDEKGSGLGLSIVKRIAALHGFQMQCRRSELGGLAVDILF